MTQAYAEYSIFSILPSPQENFMAHLSYNFWNMYQILRSENFLVAEPFLDLLVENIT